MKTIPVIMLLSVLLCGCKDNTHLDRALSLRQTLLSHGCRFQCDITADYTDALYTFSLLCTFDENGAMEFSVMEPDSICGIAGQVDPTGGKLTFQQQHLLFPVLADGYISPVSAPWLMLKSLRSGYIRSCGQQQQGLYIIMDDSFAQAPLQVEMWTDSQDIPYHCEMLWKGRRILSITLKDFCYV